MKISSFVRFWQVSITVALVTAPFMLVQAQGVGPRFDAFPIDYTGAQNTDYPMLDARNLTAQASYSRSSAEHDRGVSTNAGDTIEFLMYYHNGVADAAENIARNTRVKITFLPEPSTSPRVSAAISADNAPALASATRGGDMLVTMSGGAPQRLVYIAGSTQWFAARSTTAQPLPDGIVNGGITLGDIRAGWNYVGFVKFKVRVSGGVVTTLPQLSKTAYNQTRRVEATTGPARPGDIITYTLTYRNTGEAQLENVVIEDDITNVLQSAEVADFGQGLVNASRIRFPPASIPVGGFLAHTFQVRVKDVPTSTIERVMTNAYGNRIDIRISPTGRVAAPKSGPNELVAIIGALVITAALYVYQRQKKLKMESSPR